MTDISEQIQQQVQAAIADQTALNILGSGSKAHLGRVSEGQPLSLADHQGIINYQSTELVVTARAGTSLSELEHVLKEQQQGLAFEPPHWGATATIGGTVACNLSGPARPYAGALRDHLLGVTLINGQGKKLRFGGEVMKNVAGYDLSRLMCGAMGTLGVLLDVSLKVLPKPATELTLSFECQQAQAIQWMNAWAARPLPISASAWLDEQLYVRMSGSDNGVRSAQQVLGGELLDDGDSFWLSLREQRLQAFDSALPLWRLSVPATTEPLALDGLIAIDWGGALRWYATDLPASELFNMVEATGGHASLMRGGDRQQVFQPLPDAMMNLQRRLKQQLDPSGLFNPGRLYAEF